MTSLTIPFEDVMKHYLDNGSVLKVINANFVIWRDGEYLTNPFVKIYLLHLREKYKHLWSGIEREDLTEPSATTVLYSNVIYRNIEREDLACLRVVHISPFKKNDCLIQSDRLKPLPFTKELISIYYDLLEKSRS